MQAVSDSQEFRPRVLGFLVCDFQGSQELAVRPVGTVGQLFGSVKCSRVFKIQCHEF